MSKKLLMNNYSENGLMPVMDGLVCWLDARDIENGDTIWVDRSDSGYIFEIIGDPIIQDGYFYFDLSKPYARCTALSVDVSSVTVQCSLKDLRQGDNSYIWSINAYRGINLVLPGGDDTLGFVVKGSTRTHVQNNTNVSLKESYISLISTSNSLNCRSEGIFNEKHNYSSPISGSISGMEIGREYNYIGGGGFKGQIGSLLIYNRALTEEEIHQNYLYEQSIKRENDVETDVETDEIILCENYSPNGQKFYLWQDKTIDWDTSELYINIDLTNYTRNAWGNVLSIGVCIESWDSANHGKCHIIYNRFTKTIAVQYHYNNRYIYYELHVTNINVLELIMNKQGCFMNDKLITSNNDIVNAVNTVLQANPISIGSQEGSIWGIATYNKVSLRKYIERGNNYVCKIRK